MSRSVILVVTTKTSTLPTGIISGLLRLAIKDSSGLVVQTEDVTGLTKQFDNVAAGSYTASAQRLDSTGAALGAELTEAFTVTDVDSSAPAAGTYEEPAAITVNLG